MLETTKAPPTLEQRRARHAWEAVEKAKKSLDGEQAKTYGREAKKLPVRILAAGLGQALAFLLAKAGDRKELRQLHEHLTEWVIRERGLAAPKPDSLLQSVVFGDASFLRRATDEALAYLQWLTRFAEAEGIVGKED